MSTARPDGTPQRLCCNCKERLGLVTRKASEDDGWFPEPPQPGDLDYDAKVVNGRVLCKCGHGCHAYWWDDIPGMRDSSSTPCCCGMCPCIPNPVTRWLECSVPDTISKRNYSVAWRS